MVQQTTDQSWQAEARSEETKQFIKDIKRITRRKFTAKRRFVLYWKAFVGMPLFETCADGRAYGPVLTMPG